MRYKANVPTARQAEIILGANGGPQVPRPRVRPDGFLPGQAGAGQVAGSRSSPPRSERTYSM
ncbi:hypothetical protein GCM10010191_66390 [Actinomadura vinacea]|uniref:Transposase putative helix-turn-helix domain-containing protein n=1 Tax=Actinomadura vinacea TaxID=115336 RepID=A0ABN3JUR1_9ACTN